MSDETEITKWRDRANAAVRSFVALQERYDQLQTEAEALRPLRAAALRYGQAAARYKQIRVPLSDADMDAVTEHHAAEAEYKRLALALAAAEGQG